MASEFPKDIGQPPVGGGGMIGRIQRLLLKPNDEWAAIDGESMTAMGIFKSWAVPLAAIGPIASLIGGQVFGVSVWFAHYRPPLVGSIVTAVVQYIASLIGVWVLALVIDALAPSFGSVKNQNQAMKAAAFSYTAAWIAAILGIVPALAAIGLLLGLYSFYLLWLGLPKMMKTPADKAPGYVIVSIVVAVVAQIVILFVVGLITAPLLVATAAGPTVTIGGTTIDTGKINDAAAKLDAATKSMQSGGNVTLSNGKTVDPGALQNLLPGAIAGWNRTEVASSGGGAMGMNVSDATARFAAGDQSFSLKITDTGAMGSLAGLVNVQENKQTATGYEKTMLQDGNMVTEKWDNSSKSGTYSVLVAKRFLVEAEGSAPNIDTLKGAVTSVNIGQLASLTS